MSFGNAEGCSSAILEYGSLPHLTMKQDRGNINTTFIHTTQDYIYTGPLYRG